MAVVTPSERKLIDKFICTHLEGHGHTAIFPCITRYGSTVYIGIAVGGTALWPCVRAFQFSLLVLLQSVF